MENINEQLKELLTNFGAWYRKATHRCNPFVHYKGKLNYRGDPIERHVCPECGQTWKFLPAAATWQDQFPAKWEKTTVDLEGVNG